MSDSKMKVLGAAVVLGFGLAGCISGPVTRDAAVIGTDGGDFRFVAEEERGACRDADLVIFDCVEVTQTVFVQAADGSTLGETSEREAAYAAALAVCARSGWTPLEEVTAADGVFEVDAGGFVSVCS